MILGVLHPPHGVWNTSFGHDPSSFSIPASTSPSSSSSSSSLRQTHYIYFIACVRNLASFSKLDMKLLRPSTFHQLLHRSFLWRLVLNFLSCFLNPPRHLDPQNRRPCVEADETTQSGGSAASHQEFDPYRAATISYPPPKASTTSSSIIETPRPLHYITSLHNKPHHMPSNSNTRTQQQVHNRNSRCFGSWSKTKTLPSLHDQFIHECLPTVYKLGEPRDATRCFHTSRPIPTELVNDRWMGSWMKYREIIIHLHCSLMRPFSMTRSASRSYFGTLFRHYGSHFSRCIDPREKWSRHNNNTSKC